jgi:3-phenylpropionate/trans-cinnamate dioxygenase ferredoxin reductase component
VKVAAITGREGRVAGVELSDGSVIAADVVIGAVGITPNVGLAVAAGLAEANGIQVNAALRSSDPDIFAAGDVASAFHPVLARHLRVEHWANAVNQPPAAARAMLGQKVSYDRMPYFFTDQYDLGMEYTGYVDPGHYETVVFRGDVPGREFIAFWLGAGGRVLAGMNVNVWDSTEAIQALVKARTPVDRLALADLGTPLTELA